MVTERKKRRVEGGPEITVTQEQGRRKRFESEGTLWRAQLARATETLDETLFKNILHIKQHELHQLLPDRTQSTYNLRPRKHDCSLTVKHLVTANEFLTRMLYKDMY